MLRIWILAIRPKMLAASLCPVCIGSAMAFTYGSFDFIVFCLTLLTALGIQITCHFVNDYQDFLKGADTARQGPVRVTAAGLVSVRTMRTAAMISALCTALCSCYLIWTGGWIVSIVLLISLALAFGYTAGPFSLAYTGLSEPFVLLFFGAIAVGMTYYLQTHILAWDAWIAGWGPGAISTSILTANNLRDESGDRAHNKKTLVVRFGTRFGKLEYLLFLLSAIALPAYFFSSHPFCLMASLIVVPALLLVRPLIRGDFCIVHPKTARLLFFYTVLFCIGWML